MIEKILIPTDGSDGGKTALEYGIYLAKRLGAQITGLHVVDIRLMQGPLFTDISGSIGLPPYQELLPFMQDGLDERAEHILEIFSAKCEQCGLCPETIKSIGIVDESIIEAGKETDLIVLARRGEHFHFTTSGMIGSTAESIVRKSGKPVMVIPEVFKEIESVGLAYDGSVPADHALKLAAELAEYTSWPLTAIIITDNPSTADNRSTKIENFLEPFKVDSEIIILAGKEDREILRFIQDGSVELMIMGAYGHNRLRELIVGSTTSSIIRKSTIPVLLTR